MFSELRYVGIAITISTEKTYVMLAVDCMMIDANKTRTVELIQQEGDKHI